MYCSTGTSVNEYYAATGAPVPGFYSPLANDGTGSVGPMAISGNNLYVGHYVPNIEGYVAEYNATTGSPTSENPEGILLWGHFSPVSMAVSGNILYVLGVGPVTPYAAGGWVSEYNATTGAVITGTLVGGFSDAVSSMVLSGSDLYISDYDTGTIGEYDATTGVKIAGFTSPAGLANPAGLAISGNDLYVVYNSDSTNGTVGVYDATTGATIDSSLVSGLFFPNGIEDEPVPEPGTWGLIAGGVALIGSIQGFRRGLNKRPR
jgi:hypothetical protein